MLKIDFKKAEGLHVGGCLFTAPDLQNLFLKENKALDGKSTLLVVVGCFQTEKFRKKKCFHA